jgi:hypothetical protein
MRVHAELLKESKARQSTQKETVLKMLQEAGEQGVTNTKLRRVALRFTSIIHLLKKDGYIIETVSDGDGVYRYVLKGKTEPVKESSALDILIQAIEDEGGIVTVDRLLQIMEEKNLIFKRKSKKVV